MITVFKTLNFVWLQKVCKGNSVNLDINLHFFHFLLQKTTVTKVKQQNMAPDISDPVLSDNSNGVTQRSVNKSTEQTNCSTTEATKTSQISLDKHDNNNNISNSTSVQNDNIEFHPQIRWPDLIVQIFIHAGFVYGLYFLLTFQVKFFTYIWCEY
jgi:hypothetical protein